MKSQKEIPDKAELMIQHGERSEPERLLKKFVADIAPDWKPVCETLCSIEIAYWNREEFLNHAPNYHPGVGLYQTSTQRK